MTFVIVMGFHQIIVVMNDVKRHRYIHTYIASINRKIAILKLEDHKKKEMKLYTVYDVLNMVMCSRKDGDRFHMIKCINHECQDCADTSKKITDHYKQLTSIKLGTINYKLWQYQDVSVNVRKENAFRTETKRKRVLTECKGLFAETIQSLVSALEQR